MRLTQGFISTKDLATWFGVSYGAFRNRAESFYKRLEDFAEFEKVRGGVKIIEVYFEVYDKNQHKVDLILAKEIYESETKLATMSGMARKFKSEFDNVKDWSVRSCFSKSRDKLFGDTIVPGILGSRSRVWAVKVDDNNTYRSLSNKEIETFKQLVKRSQMEDDHEKLMDLVHSMKYDESLTKEKFLLLVDKDNLDFYESVIENFNIITGLKLVQVNSFELDECSEVNPEYRDYLLENIK